jgi:hypothetical protein
MCVLVGVCAGAPGVSPVVGASSGAAALWHLCCVCCVRPCRSCSGIRSCCRLYSGAGFVPVLSGPVVGPDVRVLVSVCVVVPVMGRFVGADSGPILWHLCVVPVVPGPVAGPIGGVATH